MLLLTEELTCPWELAVPRPRPDAALGRVVAVPGRARRRLALAADEHKPRPRPRRTVAVRTGAVLTADYTGVSGWGRLESAVAEAGEVAALFDPPAPTVAPEIWAVIDLFRSRPQSTSLHVALHGQYDAQGDQEGIVLLQKSPAGGAAAQFLTPTSSRAASLDARAVRLPERLPGRHRRAVLGDYGGFASTLLRIGAAGSSLRCGTSRTTSPHAFARPFYAATLSAAEPVAAAEAVRALRATYTEEGVRAGTRRLHATLVAYQVFGHPRLRLTRHPTDP